MIKPSKTSRSDSLPETDDRLTVDSQLVGLSSAEAENRLKTHGFNELPEGERRTRWRILLEIVREPMFLLLLGCGGIYLLLGEPGEAIILLGFVGVVIGITLFQEAKTERALEALRDLSSPRALVVRDGEQVRIAGREVVPGDLLVLAEGDRVAADAALIAGGNISVDESLLTGEAAPVRKVIWAAGDCPSPPGGDDLPSLFSGTLVVSGKGLARVLSTGSDTELGRIGTALGTIEQSETLLQKETGRVVKRLSVMGILLCAIIIVIFGLSRNDWLNGVLSGLTLAMAILPEEFPVILTIFLALGSFRLSRINVLTRRSIAVETLGAATVLCTDKTGTLTQNRMQLSALAISGQILTQSQLTQEIPESHHRLIEYAILASQSEPFDPMERAILATGRQFAGDHVHQNWTLVREYPLSRELLSMSCVWKSPDDRELIVAAKGAPETIIDLCHLSAKEGRRIERDVKKLADQGMRVLGVAHSRSEKLPGAQHDFAFEFLGLIGFVDPIRPEVPAAIAECISAGIRVIMMTGDYPATAVHIGNAIGLPRGRLVTGTELRGMTDEALLDCMKDVSIFARVIPEEKLRIVKALQARGDIVAMTGDGVNDAPALKASNIGVAMGQRGTDVARESSDLVLLDDAFSSIVGGVRMGRRIFDNLRKAMAYTIAIHIPIAGLSLLPVVLEAANRAHWPLLLMPVHIVFLELIIDPACSIVFEIEPEEAGLMQRKPRDLKETLFTTRTVILSVLQGFSVLAATVVVYAYGIAGAYPENVVRALIFSTLVLANLGLVMTNRHWFAGFIHTLRIRNNALWWMIAGAAVMLSLVLYVPWLQRLFHFDALHADDMGIALAMALLSILWFEIYKVFNGMRQRRFQALCQTEHPKLPRKVSRQPRRKPRKGYKKLASR